MIVLRRILVVLTALYWVLIVTLTHLPKVPMVGPETNDKLAHFVGYWGLTGLLFLSIWVFRPGQRWLVWVALAGVLAYGAVDELTQPWSGRDCSLADWLADAAGGISAVVLLTVVRWWVERSQGRRLHEIRERAINPV